MPCCKPRSRVAIESAWRARRAGLLCDFNGTRRPLLRSPLVKRNGAFIVAGRAVKQTVNWHPRSCLELFVDAVRDLLAEKPRSRAVGFLIKLGAFLWSKTARLQGPFPGRLNWTRLRDFTHSPGHNPPREEVFGQRQIHPASAFSKKPRAHERATPAFNRRPATVSAPFQPKNWPKGRHFVAASRE